MSGLPDFAGFPIVEFGSDQEIVWKDGTSALLWHGRRAVDLRWVAAAKSYSERDKATTITLCGSGQWEVINIAYTDFMPLWLRAKGIDVSVEAMRQCYHVWGKVLENPAHALGPSHTACVKCGYMP